ncbi:MAG TPA: hypothetical protein VMK12_20985 [Anaeromyxobacteraceae bacterium]|nr:hypothetical protein [Anaeromyxobacteraceae bacterium]
MPSQLLAMVAAEQAGRDGLEVVHQGRRLHGRVQPQQRVDVVGLAIELSALAAPALEKATKVARSSSSIVVLRRSHDTLALEPSGKGEVMELVKARAVSERPDTVSLAWAARSGTVSIRRCGSRRR